MSLSLWPCVLEKVLFHTGRGRPRVHLQEQVLMLLHFVAHHGKYGLLADKFGITHSCYFACIEEMFGIVSADLLKKHIF